jgi:RNA-directed DNA polymerase
MEEILLVAYRRCRANRGAPGCDGQSFEQIEKQGRDQWLERLRQELRATCFAGNMVSGLG